MGGPPQPRALRYFASFAQRNPLERDRYVERKARKARSASIKMLERFLGFQYPVLRINCIPHVRRKRNGRGSVWHLDALRFFTDLYFYRHRKRQTIWSPPTKNQLIVFCFADQLRQRGLSQVVGDRA